MNDLDDLQTIAFKAERAASRRLARAEGLSDEQALRRTLELAAGQAGLAALVAERLALRAAASARADARTQLREHARAEREARHAGRPSAWRAWFDGSARPNPGRCAIGVLLRGPGGVEVALSQPAGTGDSSAAEYRALIALLETALAHGADDLTIHGDSQVVVRDVGGPDALAAPALRAYRDRARALLARIERVSLRWVPRHRNALADALSQRALRPSSSNDTDTPDDAPDAAPTAT